MPRWLLVALALGAVACGGSSPPPARSEPSAAAPVDPLPAPGELEGAPACVLETAEHRRCHVEGRPSCEIPHAWRDKARLLAFSLPGDLARGWDAPLRCSVELTEWDEASERALHDSRFRVATQVGRIAWGEIALRDAFCLAELDRVRAIECEEPGPTIQ